MITIGIMSGNSFNTLKAVMTEFQGSHINDIVGFIEPFTPKFKENLKNLQKEIEQADFDMEQIVKTPLFKKVLANYTTLVIKAVENLIKKSNVKRKDIAAIGLSGLPFGTIKDKQGTFTTQIFNPSRLAKATGIDVVYDFFSDDVFNGGAGAPFMSIHNLHLSARLTTEGHFPICFLNGGSTANLTLITQGSSIKKQVFGFDCGAFNYYIRALCRYFFGKENDYNSDLAMNGQINPQLLKELYEESAITPNGENFYNLTPPKFADWHSYRMMSKLRNSPLRPEDILRTVEYFAAYSVFLSLQFIPEHFDYPKCFVTFGDGWNNPLVYYDFQNLLHGRGFILPEHHELARGILSHTRGINFEFGSSDYFGIRSDFMDAREMADMAYCCLINQPFNRQEVTGCQEECVCGIVCRSGAYQRRSGRGYTYSRAAKGWNAFD